MSSHWIFPPKETIDYKDKPNEYYNESPSPQIDKNHHIVKTYAKKTRNGNQYSVKNVGRQSS